MTSENRKLARKLNKQKNKQFKEEMKTRINDATNLLLSNPKCYGDNCNNIFDFKTSNHDEWGVRVYKNKTVILCKDCLAVE